jgi:hypothetical protein
VNHTFDPTTLPTEVGQSIRQGDVLLVRRHRLGVGAQPAPREKGAVVLAHGEATGHMHQLRGPQVTMYRDTGGHAFLKVEDRPEPLVHDEHTALGVPPGVYELAAQVEYEPAELRTVTD